MCVRVHVCVWEWSECEWKSGWVGVNRRVHVCVACADCNTTPYPLSPFSSRKRREMSNLNWEWV